MKIRYLALPLTIPSRSPRRATRCTPELPVIVLIALRLNAMIQRSVSIHVIAVRKALFLTKHRLADEVSTQTRESELSEKLWGQFRKSIFQTYPLNNESGDNLAGQRNPRQKQLVISFAGLHQMRMRKLKANLASRVMDMCFRKQESHDWEELLKEYSTSPKLSLFHRTICG